MHGEKIIDQLRGNTNIIYFQDYIFCEKLTQLIMTDDYVKDISVYSTPF